MGMETARSTVRQLEGQLQETHRHTATLDRDLQAERLVKEQKAKVSPPQSRTAPHRGRNLANVKRHGKKRGRGRKANRQRQTDLEGGS